MAVIFVRPRDEYGSYRDLWKLIQLSGYPLIYMDQMDMQSDNCYIFSTPSTHWHDGLENYYFESARARVIYYGIEWYADVDYSAVAPTVEKWSADKWYAEHHGLRYVPMGGHPDLNLYPPAAMPKRYDILTLWAPSFRRYTAAGSLQQAGVSFAPNGWGEERHIAMLQSRAMCIVHQHDHAACIAPQRWALAAAYKLPVITETLWDEGIFGKSYKLMSDLAHIGEFTAMWMRKENEKRLEDYGVALYELLCVERTFRRSIEMNL